MEWLSKVEPIFSDLDFFDCPADDALTFVPNPHLPNMHIVVKDIKPTEDFKFRFSELYWLNVVKLEEYLENRRDEGDGSSF